jgi:hypothetical protein
MVILPTKEMYLVKTDIETRSKLIEFLRKNFGKRALFISIEQCFLDIDNPNLYWAKEQWISGVKDLPEGCQALSIHEFLSEFGLLIEALEEFPSEIYPLNEDVKQKLVLLEITRKQLEIEKLTDDIKNLEPLCTNWERQGNYLIYTKGYLKYFIRERLFATGNVIWEIQYTNELLGLCIDNTEYSELDAINWCINHYQRNYLA